MDVLAGLRVVDFSGGLAGALTSMILTDFGATTVRVTRPGAHAESEPAAAMWHRKKELVELDLKAEGGAYRALDVVASADVTVMDWRPGVAERLGLSYGVCQGRAPALVYCAITGFGPRGPDARLKAYDGIVAARAGLMRGPEPVLSAVPDATFGAATGALQGILAALYRRVGSGVGQMVESSLVQGLTAYDLYGWLDEQLADRMPPDAGNASATIYPAVSGMLTWTGDGKWLQLANFRPHQLRSFLAAIERTEAYEVAAAAGASGDVLQDLVRRRVAEETLDHWLARFAEFADTAVEPLRFGAESMSHPQMVHNGDIVEVEVPGIGVTRQLGPLVRMHPAPDPPSQPSFDTARADVAGADMVAAQPADGPPLAGVTAIELAWFYAAPFGLALLADLGARVIKVENLEGDPHRYQGQVREAPGVKGLQGKQSVALNLGTPEGQEILHRLVARSQIVMRNFRQSSSERMGIGYDALAVYRPDLVYLYAAAYGSTGPYASRPAYAPTIAAAVGYPAYALGWPEPMSEGQPISLAEGRQQAETMRGAGGAQGDADAAAALGVGVAAALGLLAHRLTGQGAYMETSMLCTDAYALSEHFFDYDGRPARRVPDADRRGIGPLYRLYCAQSGWVFLASPGDDEWAPLTRALDEATDGELDLAGDDRLATSAGRSAHASELTQILREMFARRSARDWEAALTSFDIACVEVGQAPIGRYLISDPGMQENGFVADVVNPIFGPHQRHGAMVTLSANPAVAGPSARVGEHTRAVLAELGYSAEEIDRLGQAGIVSWPASEDPAIGR